MKKKVNTMITVDMLADSYLGQQRPNSRKGTRSLLSRLHDFAGPALMVESIDTAFCRRFANYLLARMKPSSAKTYLQRLHRLLHEAVSSGLLRYNPLDAAGQLLPRYVATERPYLLREDLRRLSEAPCPHEETKLAFLFSCHTGLRLSDIEALTWGDIVGQHGRRYVTKVQIKTGHAVRIPLDYTARNILARLRSRRALGEGDRVFPLYTRTIIARDLETWGNAARLGWHITFHVARHTFATMMISSGVDIFVVSQLCGHSSIAATQIYARLIDDTGYQAVTRLDRYLR